MPGESEPNLWDDENTPLRSDETTPQFPVESSGYDKNNNPYAVQPIQLEPGLQSAGPYPTADEMTEKADELKRAAGMEFLSEGDLESIAPTTGDSRMPEASLVTVDGADEAEFSRLVELMQLTQVSLALQGVRTALGELTSPDLRKPSTLWHLYVSQASQALDRAESTLKELLESLEDEPAYKSQRLLSRAEEAASEDSSGFGASTETSDEVTEVETAMMAIIAQLSADDQTTAREVFAHTADPLNTAPPLSEALDSLEQATIAQYRALLDREASLSQSDLRLLLAYRKLKADIQRARSRAWRIGNM